MYCLHPSFFVEHDLCCTRNSGYVHKKLPFDRKGLNCKSYTLTDHIEPEREQNHGPEDLGRSSVHRRGSSAPAVVPCCRRFAAAGGAVSLAELHLADQQPVSISHRSAVPGELARRFSWSHLMRSQSSILHSAVSSPRPHFWTEESTAGFTLTTDHLSQVEV